ncbi:MAG: hypothetical protein NTZ35_01260 [Ignavibacteriales bacterium]|nr:hypothetical protein [Ignavibacteriales bacterium]
MPEMTKIDSYAMQHAREYGHDCFIRLLLHSSFKFPETLIDEEEEIYRWVIKAILQRQGSRTVGRLLANQMRRKGYNCDFELVAGTLIGEHYSWGQWRYQIESVRTHSTYYSDEFIKKKGIRKEDLLVYKLVYKYGCKHCRQIWLHKDGTPKLYTEDFVRNQSTNYDKKPNEWKPQIGLVHPGCTEGGIKIARLGIDNLTYPKIFDCDVQDR